jgi:hypothetical protein
VKRIEMALAVFGALATHEACRNALTALASTAATGVEAGYRRDRLQEIAELAHAAMRLNGQGATVTLTGYDAWLLAGHWP